MYIQATLYIWKGLIDARDKIILHMGRINRRDKIILHMSLDSGFPETLTIKSEQENCRIIAVLYFVLSSAVRIINAQIAN